MKTIPVGIVGYGFMGKLVESVINSALQLDEDLRTHVECEVVGIYTGSLKSRDLYPGVELLSNLAEFEKLAPEIVYVGSPSEFHAQQLLELLEILPRAILVVDKPVVVLEEEYRKLRMMLSERPKLAHRVFVLFEYRFIPAVAMIKRLIGDGKVGRVHQFRVNYFHGSYLDERAPTWRLEIPAGGSLRDLGPHCIDLVHYLVGDVTKIRGVVKNLLHKRQVDDAAWAIVECGENCCGTIEVSRVATGAMDNLAIELYGERGAIKWSLERLNELEFFSRKDEPAGWRRIWCTQNQISRSFLGEKVSNGWVRAHELYWSSIIKHHLTDGASGSKIPNLEDGLKAHSVISRIS